MAVVSRKTAIFLSESPEPIVPARSSRRTIDRALSDPGTATNFRQPTPPALRLFDPSHGPLTAEPVPVTPPSPTLRPTPTPLRPTAARIVRLGVHRQPTRIVVTFRGQVDPVQAQDPSNYSLVGPGRDGLFGTADDEHLGVVSATFDPNTNSVTLAPGRRLRAHDHVLFTARSPVTGCPGGHDFVTLFGGRQSLGGFLGEHRHNIFTAQDGHIVGKTPVG